MERKSILRVVLLCSLAALFLMPIQAYGQDRPNRPAGQGRQGGFGRGGLFGDWEVTMKFGEREMKSILSFSRQRGEDGQPGDYTGYWISFWGMNELKDVKFEDNNLSFTQVMRFGDQERTSKFTGKIEEGKLTGKMVGNERETEITGQRPPRSPRGVGNWEMKITAGEREYTGTLSITADKEGNLSGKWKSSRGESELQDLKYENRTLSFKRTIKTDNGEWTSTFEGTLDRDSAIEGVFKSDRGEAKGTGALIGAAAIGTWNLEIASERGARKQRLQVNRDMSGMYGSMPIEKIALEDGKISFKYTMEFGDQKFETSFEGTIEEDKLTGELKTTRGTNKVTGTKRQFRFGRPQTNRG